MIELAPRVHLFAKPAQFEAMATFFSDVLGCDVLQLDFGFAHPILLIRASVGAWTVEFSESAPDPDTPSYGAWIEFIVDDREATQARLRATNTPEFEHAGSAHAYFRAPNGQVFRVINREQLGAP